MNVSIVVVVSRRTDRRSALEAADRDRRWTQWAGTGSFRRGGCCWGVEDQKVVVQAQRVCVFTSIIQRKRYNSQWSIISDSFSETGNRVRDQGQRFMSGISVIYFPNPGSSLGLGFLPPTVNTFDLHLSFECGSGRHFWAMQWLQICSLR